MAAINHPVHEPGRIRSLRTLREAFWVIALALIGCYAFFVILGAFSPADVVPVSILVVALGLLWLGHALAARRSAAERRDPRLTGARERRGF